MSLRIQILTLLVSIIYGAISYILFLIFKKKLINKNIMKKLIYNLIFIYILSTIYFFIIKYVNNAILTIYSYISIIIGIFTTNNIINKIKTYKK